MRSERNGLDKVRQPGFFRNPPKKLLDSGEYESHSYVRGPLFPRKVLYALLVFFGVAVMLTADWFGLLLNADGMVR